MSPQSKVGNILGSARAEIDTKMLKVAFVKTHDFSAITTTTDFNFVVGRRGTGKSALFIKSLEKFSKDKKIFSFAEAFKEYGSLSFQTTLSTLVDDYSLVKAITRVAWRATLMMSVLESLTKHYKFDKCSDYQYLRKYFENQKGFIKLQPFNRCVNIVNTFSKHISSAEAIPGTIASNLDVETLNHAVKNSLNTINNIAIFLFDGLDEGWLPNQTATGILGGLAAAASDFADSQSGVYAVIFIRDNIFRALSVFDRDFSRHIEGNTLRLRWDEDSLFELVGKRLRESFDLQKIENNVKIWNRFAHKKLKDRQGFKECLKYTLYRPRDLLVLLNQAFITASRSGRNKIIDQDIEISSKQISKNRLNDLLKEYDSVFPGIRLFINRFQGLPGMQSFENIAKVLEEVIKEKRFENPKESFFALLESGKEAFFALYSIGFIGIEDPTSNKLIFCHDGSPANLDAVGKDQITSVHPCYWKALDIQVEDLSESVLSEIYDDYYIKKGPELLDFRMKRIGQIISELPPIPYGTEGASDFEKWVFRSIKILFSGRLSNPELKPNTDAIQRRDIVATNMAETGFWKRVYEDYKSRQIIFEVKNYSKLKPDDFRQVLGYTSGDYGHFVIIVNRLEGEGLNETDKGWIQEIWHNHKRMVFILPAKLIARCVSKLRKTDRFDYTEKLLNKRLDTFTRSYLSLKHRKNPK